MLLIDLDPGEANGFEFDPNEIITLHDTTKKKLQSRASRRKGTSPLMGLGAPLVPGYRSGARPAKPIPSLLVLPAKQTSIWLDTQTAHGRPCYRYPCCYRGHRCWCSQGSVCWCWCWCGASSSLFTLNSQPLFAPFLPFGRQPVPSYAYPGFHPSSLPVANVLGQAALLR